MKNLKFFLLIISLIFFLDLTFFSLSYANLYIVKDQEGNNVCVTNQETLISKYESLGYIISIVQGSNSSQELSEPQTISEPKSKIEPELNSIPTLNSEKKDSIIKVVDWTNYISDTGNYFYVEGILQNIGKVNATDLKVSIQALDKNKKLVSITNGYAEPSTLIPNGKAIFNIMVSYKPEIKYFVLSINN